MICDVCALGTYGEPVCCHRHSICARGNWALHQFLALCRLLIVSMGDQKSVSQEQTQLKVRY